MTTLALAVAPFAAAGIRPTITPTSCTIVRESDSTVIAAVAAERAAPVSAIMRAMKADVTVRVIEGGQGGFLLPGKAQGELIVVASGNGGGFVEPRGGAPGPVVRANPQVSPTLLKPGEVFVQGTAAPQAALFGCK